MQIDLSDEELAMILEMFKVVNFPGGIIEKATELKKKISESMNKEEKHE